MEGGNQNLQTPLLLASSGWDFNNGGSRYNKGDIDILRVSLSSPGDNESTAPATIIEKSGGGFTQKIMGQWQKRDENSLGAKGDSAPVAEAKRAPTMMIKYLRFGIACGQWISAMMLVTGFPGVYLMINLLMLSLLWATAPASSSNTPAEIVTEEGQPPKWLSRLGYFDFLPITLWTTLSLLGFGFYGVPEASGALLMAIALPASFVGLTIMAALVGLFRSERYVSFQVLEEKYFEYLRDQEDEQSRRLTVQQKCLAYLEEESGKHDRDGDKMPGFPIRTVLLLCTVALTSIIYNFSVISTLTRQDPYLTYTPELPFPY